MGLIGIMSKHSNVLSRDVLIGRGAYRSFKNIIYLFVKVWLSPCLVVLMYRREIPVSIPNTEVKPTVVDDTALKRRGKVD